MIITIAASALAIQLSIDAGTALRSHWSNPCNTVVSPCAVRRAATAGI